MQLIAMASQKGGAGKTMLAQNLAFAAHEAGRKVAIFDLDPQMTSLNQFDKRTQQGLDGEPMTIAATLNRLPQLLRAAKNEGRDLIIYDMPPNIGQESFLICNEVDLVLIPTQPQAYDLEAIEATIAIASTVNTPGAVVINRVPKDMKDLAEDARQFVEVKCSYPVAPNIIHDRSQFMEAAAAGSSPLIMHPRTQAAKEVKELWGWVSSRLEQMKSLRGNAA
ncbi:ParA family protein [Hirschia maritima]|uniref:ParA family protein n=1 Tax=Hirschia maritima TaxID=1121961 RepID=UPI0003754CAA|nr:ParA family protein [Hirschia maritima]